MRRRLLLGLSGVLAWGLISGLGAAEEKKAEKKPIETFTSAKKAGIDYVLQGEYVGEYPGKGKIGAQVIADGDGVFTVRFLAGGLPGEGWDGSPEHKVTGKRENGKVPLMSPEGSGEISEGKITGKNASGEAFVL